MPRISARLKIWSFSTDFHKAPTSNVEVKPPNGIHDDTRTDMTKVTGVFFFETANAPKNTCPGQTQATMAEPPQHTYSEIK